MKLIPLTILFTSFAVDVIAQKFRQDQYSFPPHFQVPNAGVFASDNTLYLPPESHTTLPYFPIKNPNLQFPYLPPTGTKAPAIYPTPFPFLISTTLVPHFDDDDEGGHGAHKNMMQMSTSRPPMRPQTNYTDKAQEASKEKREMRAFPKIPFPQPIDRNDVKPPNIPNFNPSPMSAAPNNQKPAARRMIISAETQKTDLTPDQLKAASSFQNSQFVQGPALYIPSSTTEPAIPILRLSNEMDLDGSFSYEALGADQTHYVQHSRMENMGTDKEEQVVEGSYSYVGDNGQTYTVHYIADSNGFRASGDHLPVAPPVPEIIQRAVQYNLDEEAKRPPHLKSWQDDGRDNELRESGSNNNNFVASPPRNLFTGRAPEAFSYSFSQGTNTQNNLATAASTQAPIKTIDFTTEQSKAKANNGQISPQITFLASQGAHVPSVNSIQDSISRMFTSGKQAMPQIVNYEAGVKETDQEANKGLWRWQYGLNANTLNQNSNKETISRSFGEGDDVMINFSDMTPDQYTKMIKSQLESNPENVVVQQYIPTRPIYNDQNNNYQNNYYQSDKSSNMKQHVENQNYLAIQENRLATTTTEKVYIPTKQIDNDLNNNYYNNYYQNDKTNNMQLQMENQHYLAIQENKQASTTTENVEQNSHIQSDDWYKRVNNLSQIPEFPTTVKPIEQRESRPATTRLITQKDFTVPTQTITQSYNFEDTFYEPRKLRTLSTDSSAGYDSKFSDVPKTYFEKSISSVSPWANTIGNEIKTSTVHEEPFVSTVANFKFTDFIVQESKNDFKPITTSSTEAPRELETTAATTIEDIIDNNIFLKNLFKPEQTTSKVEEIKNENNITEESKKVDDNKIEAEPSTVEAEPKTDKIPEFIAYQPKPSNEIKVFKKKPMDIVDILNYVKNQFEFNKMKPKNQLVVNNYDHRNDVRFIPIQHENEGSNVEVTEHKPSNFRTQHFEHEIRGNIKNYKVLHRNNNVNRYESVPQLKTELSPPPLKNPNLPPLGRAGPSMKSYLPPIFV